MKKRIIIFALTFIACYLSACFVFGSWDFDDMTIRAVWLGTALCFSTLAMVIGDIK